MNEFSSEKLPSGQVERRPRRRPKLTPLTLIIFSLGIGLGFSLCYRLVLHRTIIVPEPSKGLSTCVANLAEIRLALEAYQRKHQKLPESQYDLLDGYLHCLPRCPDAQRMSYRTTFGPRTGFNLSDDPNYFLIECTGENHKSEFVAPNNPSFDNKKGLRLMGRWGDV